MHEGRFARVAALALALGLLMLLNGCADRKEHEAEAGNSSSHAAVDASMEGSADAVYTYRAKPALPDMDATLTAFFGEEERMLREYDPGAPGAVSRGSDDLTYDFFWWAEYGVFQMAKPSGIPLKYRAEGEGAQLPTPSPIEGKYSAQEAVELAKAFLNSVLGFDVSTLAVDEIVPEDPNKTRSRAYTIFFVYTLDGRMVLAANPAGNSTEIEVSVTDDGVVVAKGIALMFERDQEISGAKLLTADELRKRNDYFHFETMRAPELRLCVTRWADGVGQVTPVWHCGYLEEEAERFGKSFDATNGKELKD